MDPNTNLVIVDLSEVPYLDEDVKIEDNFEIVIAFPNGAPAKRTTIDRLRQALTPTAEAVPTVVFITPTPLSTSILHAGDTVLLQVRATDQAGIASVQFSTSANPNIGMGVLVGSYYQLPYEVPAGGSTINFSAKALNTKGGSAIASSFALVTAVLPTPPAPTFADFVDNKAGGSVRVVAAVGVPMSEYVYKIGSLSTTYAQVPVDGVLNVGNVSGRVYVYSLGSVSRNQSPVASSPDFSTAAQVPDVTFLDPVSGDKFPAGSTLLLRLKVTDPLGQNIGTVRVYNGSLIIGNATPTSPTEWQVPYTLPATAGTVNFRAEAINEDDVTGSGSCFVFVKDGATNTTPPAPEFVFDDGANKLLFNSPLGESEIEVNPGGSGYVAYAAVPGFTAGSNGNPNYIAVGDVNRAPGYWKARIKAAAGRNASNVTDSPEFHATTTAPTFAQHLQPGANVATLTWNANAGVTLDYNNPVQATASAPGADGMAVYFPDLQTQVGLLNFDHADAGHACGVTIGGTTYTKISGGAALTFTNGDVLLSL